jgi:chromosome segregation ATPase
MAKKNLDKEQSTTITTRIDLTAKTIINRSNKSYRKILEDDAYSSIGQDDVKINVVSYEELSELKEDISILKRTLENTIQDIEYYESKLEKAKETEKIITKQLNFKQSKLDKFTADMEDLEVIKAEYADKINYGISDAAAEIEEVLKHNYDLRKRGPRARVKESEIKKICLKYKVTIGEALKKVNPEYLDCMEKVNKYF